MARTKKSVAEHKLNGSYRKDRYGNQEVVENKLSELSELTADTKLVPPPSITDDYVKKYYIYHTSLLIKLGILNPADLPEIEQMYFILQQEREVQNQLKDVDPITELKKYDLLTKLEIKLGKRFSELAVKYYISPSARTHLQLDNLELENKKSENSSIVKRLLASKKD